MYGKTRKEAQERLGAALTAADNGIRPIRDRGTVAAYLDEWAVTVAAHVRPRTAESYAATARLYLIPSLGAIPLAMPQPEQAPGGTLTGPNRAQNVARPEGFEPPTY